MESEDSSSFSSFRAYGRALAQTPARLAKRVRSVTTSQEEMTRVRARSGAEMRSTLKWPALLALGIGGMVGAGVFVTTGAAAKSAAGPAVVLSYAIAGFCALLSAFCYAEFAVEMPVAGGAFSYLRVTFGELAAFMVGANLITEYVLSNAAVARSFTAYLGTAVGIDAGLQWRITVGSLPKGFNQLDLLAVGVILAITVSICHSTKESSTLNMVLTGVHLLFILFIIVVGFWRGDVSNLTRPAMPEINNGGFFPYGVGGVFNGAAMVYLSYIGYDAVSTMAEEVENPARDIPIGVSGSVAIVTVLYCLVAASISMLVPYDAIDDESAFSAAFVGSDGWSWASNVIGVGACLGILTSLMVAMLGQARYLCVIGRSNIVPSWFARVNETTRTPVNASVFLGVITALIALFTDLGVLLNLVSIGTLFVFYMVANAVVYRRYTVGGTTTPCTAAAFLLSLSAAALLFSLLWRLASPGPARAVLLAGAAIAAAVAALLFQSTARKAPKPPTWGVPLMPWLPSLSIFLNVFLLCSLDGPSYLRFAFFSALALAVYVFYSVHASYDAEESRKDFFLRAEDCGCQKV
ncbi:cationic amino acid transporter 6, chloroplastic-like [Wolffia australiana]